MAYQWPLDPDELFGERYPQMAGLGLPAEDLDVLRASIREMWPDAPGGWVWEWSKLAGRYADEGRRDLAAMAYGFAKFPAIVDDAKQSAFERQLEEYQLASADFPVSFERRVLDLPYGDGTTRVPVHILAAHGLPPGAPVLLASGGVDSWKMDLHPMMVAMAVSTGARVVTFDIPGTGESELALTAESTAMIDALVAEARTMGDGRVAHLGISMGGYLSAYTGLSGIVDAAVDLGGPVDASFAPGREWRFGMADIVANAAGFDTAPTPQELAAHYEGLSLRHLLEADGNSPMLVVNGADDVHVPQHDTLVFEGRRATRVELLSDTGHCATTRLGEVIPMIASWLAAQLAGETVQA